jgi:hypothetical protein
LSGEAIPQQGIGFKSIDLKSYYQKVKRISEFIVDETLIKVGSELVWLLVAIDRARKQADSHSNCIQGKKEYAYCGEIHVIKDSQESWENIQFLRMEEKPGTQWLVITF